MIKTTGVSAWVRRCLTIACVLATWLVVRPAAAAAPFCDDRGASALAPTPTLDIQMASVDIGEHEGGCADWMNADHGYEQGRRPATGSPAPHFDVMPTTALRPLRAFAPIPFASPTLTTVPSSGATATLERPPRD